MAATRLAAIAASLVFKLCKDDVARCGVAVVGIVAGAGFGVKARNEGMIFVGVNIVASFRRKNVEHLERKLRKTKAKTCHCEGQIYKEFQENTTSKPSINAVNAKKSRKNPCRMRILLEKSGQILLYCELLWSNKGINAMPHTVLLNSFVYKLTKHNTL